MLMSKVVKVKSKDECTYHIGFRDKVHEYMRECIDSKRKRDWKRVTCARSNN